MPNAFPGISSIALDQLSRGAYRIVRTMKATTRQVFFCTVVRITLVGNASFLGTSPANGNPDTSNT